MNRGLLSMNFLGPSWEIASYGLSKSISWGIVTNASWFWKLFLMYTIPFVSLGTIPLVVEVELAKAVSDCSTGGTIIVVPQTTLPGFNCCSFARLTLK